MLKKDVNGNSVRPLTTTRLNVDMAVVGGGMAGVCSAITAARQGCKVALVHDRPVLGGNASSEVRLWILGATSHMGNNNRWAREGGVIDEILVENTYRNPEGNPVIFDSLLLEMARNESNITVLLNTAVHDLEKSDPDTIISVRAFCSQNSTSYEIRASLFVDSSGDGILGFMAGAAFRMGSEDQSEFGEKFAPKKSSGELLGHSIYFYSKDAGRPVKFVPPSFALSDITRIPRWRDIRFDDSGCRLWWLEWGGDLDTVHDCEQIKWELWKVAYGVWNHIKNSGRFPESETLTLEWVGAIPGKRESRRFEGDYMLTQQDIIEQRTHPDVVSYGGWAIDLHPSDGVYSEKPGCQQWHSKGIYGIPYRTMYSRNISNLFLAGRIISASHVAFGSTRVMGTCAQSGQAVGMAAALCIRDGLKPREVLQPARMQELQRELLRTGQTIPGIRLDDPEDFAPSAQLTASSELKLSRLDSCGETLDLRESWAMLLPVRPGPMPQIEVVVDIAAPATLRAELRVSSRPDNHTPDVTLGTVEVGLKPGTHQRVPLQFNTTIDVPRYAFVCLLKNDNVAVHLSDQRLTGILALCNFGLKAVAKGSLQEPPEDSGIDSFEFWVPRRRPLGKNFAMRIDPPLAVFGTSNLTNGFTRPTSQANAWVASFADEQPFIRLSWHAPQRIARIELCFDTDFDHPMETVLLGHPERIMPFCIQKCAIYSRTAVAVPAGRKPEGDNRPLMKPVAEIEENHHSLRVISFPEPIETDCLELRLVAPSVNTPAALFAIRCYGSDI